MNAIWKSIPKHLKTPELMKDITRWGESAKSAARYKTTGAMPSELTKRAASPIAKGMMAAAPLVGAGAAATAAWAYPMKRLGERIGYGIEEKKAGRRLRPEAMPFKEVAPHLPGVQAMKKFYNRAFGKTYGNKLIKSVRFKKVE